MKTYFEKSQRSQDSAAKFLRSVGAQPHQIDASISASNAHIDAANELANYAVDIMSLDDDTVTWVAARLFALFVARRWADEPEDKYVSALHTIIQTIVISADLHRQELAR